MIIDYDHAQVKVPYEILEYCDRFTYDVNREDLRYIDCVYMNMGYYGNDLVKLHDRRKTIMPVIE